MKYFTIAFLCVFFLACKQKASEAVMVLEPIVFSEKILEKEVQLVDVRTPEEWAEGVINNALKINFLDDSFKANVEKLDKNKPIAIYCRSGGRSAKASKLLTEIGFKEVYDLKGGILNWNNK